MSAAGPVTSTLSVPAAGTLNASRCTLLGASVTAEQAVVPVGSLIVPPGMGIETLNYLVIGLDAPLTETASLASR